MLVVLPFASYAAVCSTDPVPNDTRHEFQFSAGYSPSSSTLIGTATNRKFLVVGFNYSYRCWTWNNVSISYTGGIMPAAIVRQPNLTYYSEFFATTTPAHSVYGFGITPLGFTFDFERAHKVYPFAQIDGGIIASTESIPDNIANTSALNFLFDFGGGVKWRPNDRYAFTFGYKFLHISNAGTTSVNPGLDNNLVYAGFSLLK